MKSTKDNKPAIKFSDIVKELHSYANSEKAIDDFSSELLKIANLPEEFDLSLSYFGYYHQSCSVILSAFC